VATFSRYSPEAIDVADKDPANVLLDLFEVQEDFETVRDESLGIEARQRMQVEDLCSDTKPADLGARGASRFAFEIRANGQPAKVFIHYNAERKRYILESPDLDRRYHYRAQGPGKGLVTYLNQEQSFRVIPASGDAIYVDGSFYRPLLEFGDRFEPERYHVGKILEAFDVLQTIGSEKGKVCEGDDWDPGCLFGLISRRGDQDPRLRRAFGDPEIFVCDDLGTEVADFIIADPADRVDRRVVFIHAKASKRFRPYSASALGEVCAQAIKNIRYLSMFNETPPPNLQRWSEPWQIGDVTGTARRIRIPHGSADSAALWQSMQRRIADPGAYREVWLFLGNMLSKRALEEQLARRKPAPEAIQAFVLLHGTMATVGSIDAKLRVFCCP
jgi:hypothetical protein